MRFLLLFLALLVAGPACAQGVLRKATEDAVAAECRAAGGSGNPGPGLVGETDLNGDGLPDFVVDYQQSGCRRRDGANPFCTAFGCTVKVLLSAGRGQLQKGFEGQVQAWRVRQGKGGARFEARRVSAFCNGGDRSGCSEIRQAKGTSLALVSTGTEKFAREPLRARLARGAADDEAEAAPARRRPKTALRDRGRNSKPYEPPPEAEAPLTPTPAAPVAPSAQAPEARKRTLQNAPYVP